MLLPFSAFAAISFSTIAFSILKLKTKHAAYRNHLLLQETWYTACSQMNL